MTVDAFEAGVATTQFFVVLVTEVVAFLIDELLTKAVVNEKDFVLFLT